jgi:nitrite reductase/ring-hydroxylating ferredoxin subunit
VSRAKLCRADEIAEGTGRGFRLGAGTEQIAVFVIRTGGALHAYANSCPHVGTPLDFVADRFFTRDGKHLLCGTHGAQFRPEDGLCIAGPCLGRRLFRAEISLEDGEVMLALTSPGNS